MTTTNFHILIIKHVGMTNTASAKIKIISELFGKSIAIPYTNEPGAFSPRMQSAIKWLSANGFDIVGQGEGKGHDYIITNTFKSPKA